jgi:hypothetical protein
MNSNHKKQIKTFLKILHLKINQLLIKKFKKKIHLNNMVMDIGLDSSPNIQIIYQLERIKHGTLYQD